MKTRGILTSSCRRPSTALTNPCNTTCGGRSLPFARAGEDTAAIVTAAIAASTARQSVCDPIDVAAATRKRRSEARLPPPPSNALRCYRLPVEFASMALTVAGTLAGTGVPVTLRIPGARDQRELLNAATADRFAGVEVALGVDCHHVQECEVAGHVSGPAESAENRRIRSTRRRRVIQRTRVVQDPHDFVSAIRLVHEALHDVRREVHVPRRTRRADRRSARNDRYLLHERAGRRPRPFRIDIESILAAIACVDEAVVGKHDAMRMATVPGGELAGTRPHPAHLPLISAVLVEHDHAVVAVAVRDIDFAVGGIHGDVSREAQIYRAGAGLPDVSPTRSGASDEVARCAHRINSRVTFEFRADRHQQMTVVRIFLHDAVAVASDPHVVLVIDEATMNAVRQDGVLAADVIAGRTDRAGGHERRIAPRVDDVAGSIELDDRRRRLRLERTAERARMGVGAADALRRSQSAGLKAARNDENVILR